MFLAVDESIRSLEHALAASPADASARLRLASALAHAGRRGEALSVLDLDRVDAGAFAAARALADELWAAELSRLEPAVELRHGLDLRLDSASPLPDLSGELVLWDGEVGRIVVTSLETGENVFEGAGTIRRFHTRPFRGGFFFLDRARQAVRRLAWRAGRIEETQVAVEVDVDDVEPSPSGDLVVLTTGLSDLRRWHWEDDEPCPTPHQTAHRWPSLEPLVSVEGYDQEIDWDVGAFLDRTGRSQGRTVRPLDGSAPWEIPCDAGVSLSPLGRGVCVDYVRHSLVGVRRGWRVDALRRGPGSSSDIDGPLSLSEDGRGVRVIEGGFPIRLDLDVGTGEVLGTRRGREKGTTGTWHPRADVFVEHRFQHMKAAAVRGFEGRLLELPAAAQGVKWVLGGRGLIVIGGSDAARYELWRAR
jgi:hypothetical protein